MRQAVVIASLTVIGACILACPGPQPPPAGRDLFRVAVSGSPGSLLSVWGVPGGGLSAFIAGGFVGVDHAAIADGVVGRLVEYGSGSFTTRCTTDEVLWWVTGVSDGAGHAVFGTGEGARVVRYQGGRCEVLAVDAAVAARRPTFWGAYAAAVDDVWLVGGSASADGPRGVLVHYDGTTFRQEAGLPEAAQAQNLYKIDREANGTYVVVGTGGIVLRRDPTSGTWSQDDVGERPNDDTLFTTSCARFATRAADAGVADCWAVGGRGIGYILHGSAGTWAPVRAIGGAPLGDLPGLNGVYAQDSQNVFIVGTNGFTMHTNGSQTYVPPTAPTTASLHGVGGNGSVVIAVGGEVGTTTPEQRGVILIRNDPSEQFTFDGQVFMATGELRGSLGGTGQ